MPSPLAVVAPVRQAIAASPQLAVFKPAAPDKQLPEQQSMRKVFYTARYFCTDSTFS